MRRLRPGFLVLLIAVPHMLRAEPGFRELEATALQLWEAGRLEESLPRLRRLHELQPYNDRIAFLLARTLILAQPEGPAAYRQRLGEAVVLLDQSLALDAHPEDDRAARWFFAGLARWFRSERRLAASCFERSLRLDLHLGPAAYNLAIVYRELGQLDDARRVERSLTTPD